MLGLATKIMSTGLARSCWCSRNTSRKSRRARFRTTALPSLLLTTTANRVCADSPGSTQFNNTHPVVTRCPLSRMRMKSHFRLRRISERNLKRLGWSAGIGLRFVINVQTGVSRFRPLRLRLRKISRPPLVARLAKKPYWRFRLIRDG